MLVAAMGQSEILAPGVAVSNRPRRRLRRKRGLFRRGRRAWRHFRWRRTLVTALLVAFAVVAAAAASIHVALRPQPIPAEME
jgi:hypothetical protein